MLSLFLTAACAVGVVDVADKGLSDAEMKLLSSTNPVKYQEALAAKQKIEAEPAQLRDLTDEERNYKANVISELGALSRKEEGDELREEYNEAWTDEDQGVNKLYAATEYAAMEPAEESLYKNIIKPKMDANGYSDEIKRDWWAAKDFVKREAWNSGLTQKVQGFKDELMGNVDQTADQVKSAASAAAPKKEKETLASTFHHATLSETVAQEQAAKGETEQKSFLGNLADCWLIDPQGSDCALAMAESENAGLDAETKVWDKADVVVQKGEDMYDSVEEGTVIKDTAANAKYAKQEYDALKSGDKSKAPAHSMVVSMLEKKETVGEEKQDTTAWLSEKASSISAKVQGLAKTTLHKGQAKLNELKKQAKFDSKAREIDAKAAEDLAKPIDPRPLPEEVAEFHPKEEEPGAPPLLDLAAEEPGAPASSTKVDEKSPKENVEKPKIEEPGA